MKSVISSTSGVSTKAHWMRMRSLPVLSSMSPRPISCSAPPLSRMVRLSTLLVTRKAMRAGKLALMVPVMMLTLGRCVAMIRWMPMARASCARRAMGVSTSRPAVMIRSANSSTTSTM